MSTPHPSCAHLAAAQKALNEARAVHAKTVADIERAKKIKNDYEVESASLADAEAAETMELVDLIQRGQDPSKLTPKQSIYEQRLVLEARERNIFAALETLDEKLDESESAVKAAEDAVAEAVDEVIASHGRERLAHLLKLDAELHGLRLLVHEIEPLQQFRHGVRRRLTGCELIESRP